jgi:threonyl-tRNA synthetase
VKKILAPWPGEFCFNTTEIGEDKAIPGARAQAGKVVNREAFSRKGARMSHTTSEKYEESKLYKMRHSAAHIMAQAVLEMFPDGKITIGPPIENGFYYDFDLPRNLTS